MDTHYSRSSSEERQDRSGSTRPPVEKPKKGNEKEEASLDRTVDQPAEAESDANDALMETYNG